MTSFVALIIALLAALALFAAGYFIGVKRGVKERDALRSRLTAKDTTTRMQFQELIASLQRQEQTQRHLESDMHRYLEQLSDAPTDADRIRQDLNVMLAPLLARDRDDVALRTTMQELLGPIVAREQLGYELANIDLGTAQRGELPRLLDDIADRGNFSTVMLSDDSGLPLAVSKRVDNMERLTGLCSLVMVLADRLGRTGGPRPRAVMVHDEDNHFVLNRLFEVEDNQLLLTAVSTGISLAPVALDPALVKIQAVLGPSEILG